MICRDHSGLICKNNKAYRLGTNLFDTFPYICFQIDHRLPGGYIWVGVCPGTPKGGGGVLCVGTAQKGGLRCGNIPKKGGLRCGTTRIRGGGLKHIYNPKKWEFRTDFVKREGVRN